mgnify:CR=1 FL=1
MSGRDLGLEGLLSPADGAGAAIRHGIVTAPLVAIADACAWVRLSEGQVPVAARTAIELVDDDVGRELIVAFDRGDPARPLVLGRVLASPLAPGRVVHAQADGQRLVITARERIVLECGEASITLTRSGKVLVRGVYVQSRAVGVNSIKGGSIELN